MKKKFYFAAALLSATPLANAELFSDTFNITASGANSVGYLDFTINSTQTVDIFTTSASNQTSAIDPEIFVFEGFASTLNSSSVLIGNDDDSCPDSRCGSSSTFRNALLDDITLNPGDYTIAVSDFDFSLDEAINGSNNNELTGDVTVKVTSSGIIDTTTPVITNQQTLAEQQAIAQLELEAQRSQQVIRQTTVEISQHLASEIPRSFGFSANPLGASADEPSTFLPDVFWGKASYTNLSDDDGPRDYVTDLYQFVGGIDKQIGDFYVGSALTYVYGDSRQTGNSNNSNTIGITPYLAYKINQNFFASALAGYNYTHINGTSNNNDADVHDYYGEFNLNGFYVLDSFIFKGRAGLRYKHNFTSLKNSLDSDFDELVWLGDAELGYTVNESLTVYTGTLYEYRDREAYNTSPFRGVSSSKIHDGVVYVRAGFDYHVATDVYLGLSALTEVTDEDNDIYTVSFNVRIEL